MARAAALRATAGRGDGALGLDLEVGHLLAHRDDVGLLRPALGLHGGQVAQGVRPAAG